MTAIATAESAAVNLPSLPDTEISVRQVFGLDSDMRVPAFGETTDLVPDVDESYQFDHDTTMAIEARGPMWSQSASMIFSAANARTAAIP